MSTLLSICIPTYNRSDFLKECLDSILQSAQGVERQIEIVISDNAGTDDTESMVLEMQKRFQCIRYNRNSENIGCERNVHKAVSIASGEYIWLIGDDDKLSPQSVPAMLAHLQSGYDMVISNYRIYDKDFSTVKVPSRFNFPSEMDFRNPNEVMRVFGTHLGFMSMTVIRRARFLSTPFSEYELFAEYGFSIMFAAYAGLLPDARILYTPELMVLNRAENSGNYDWYKFFVEGTSRALDMLHVKGYSADAVHAAKRINIKDFVIRDILVRKRDGRSTGGLFHVMLPFYRSEPLFWIGCVPALLMPGFAVKLLDRLVFLPKRLARMGQSIKGGPSCA